jgi:hypothetical protein
VSSLTVRSQRHVRNHWYVQDVAMPSRKWYEQLARIEGRWWVFVASDMRFVPRFATFLYKPDRIEAMLTVLRWWPLEWSKINFHSLVFCIATECSLVFCIAAECSLVHAYRRAVSVFTFSPYRPEGCSLDPRSCGRHVQCEPMHSVAQLSVAAHGHRANLVTASSVEASYYPFKA